jgi:hypothetical protein
MNDSERYEGYPVRIVVLSNLFSLSIYAIGAYVLWMIAPLVSALYLVYCSVLEIRVLRHSCRNCYYYGKACCFGRGLLCSFLLEKGDPKKFTERQVSWLDILPDFMVTIIPVLGGIVLLVDKFSWTIVALILILLALGFAGNAFIRGSYACKYCKQRDLGCPALSLFEPRKSP